MPLQGDHETNSGELPPLIVTLGLDKTSAEALTHWRQRYFPAERNFLQAHLTLFHKLPGAESAAVESALMAVTAASPSFEVRFVALHQAGGFIGVRVEALPLAGLKKTLNHILAGHLCAQDRQGLRPHITLMNKVTTAAATLALLELEAEFSPWSGVATGLRLHRYLQGPWQELAFYPFRAALAADGISP